MAVSTTDLVCPPPGAVQVSHDLQELEPLVDCAWRMLPGGRLEASPWPLPKDDEARA
jgi:hypothetical protein